MGHYSSPTIEGNEITSNEAEYGGGIYAGDNSSPTIYGNEITGNQAMLGGGGINVQASSILVLNTPDDNTYADNQPNDISYEP